MDKKVGLLIGGASAIALLALAKSNTTTTQVPPVASPGSPVPQFQQAIAMFEDVVASGLAIGFVNYNMIDWQVGLSVSTSGSVKTLQDFTESRLTLHTWAMTAMVASESFVYEPVLLSPSGGTALQPGITLDITTPAQTFEGNYDTGWIPFGSVIPAGSNISVARIAATLGRTITGYLHLYLR
jgi:hypothetical protein